MADHSSKVETESATGTRTAHFYLSSNRSLGVSASVRTLGLRPVEETCWLTEAEAKALVLWLAPLVGIFASEQPVVIGNGDRGIRPPAAVMKDRETSNEAFRDAVEKAAEEGL